MTNRLWNLFVAVVLAFVLVSTYGMYVQSRECAARGGAPVRGAFGMVCVAAVAP